MLIVISINILAMVLDLMHVEVLLYQIVGGPGKNVIIFGADMSSLVNIHNNRKYI